MAHCRGRSGPLDDVLRSARSLGLHPEREDIQALDALAARLAERVRTEQAAAEIAVAAELAVLNALIANGDPRDGRDRARIESEMAGAVARIDAEILRLEAQRGPLRRLVNLFRVAWARSRGAAWRQWGARELRLVDSRAAARVLRREALRAEPAREVGRRVREHVERLDACRRLLASPAMVGARAEMRVADELRALPVGFHVLHHLRLRASHFLRHNGTPLMSAELDHVVVGPTGVWAIETKCWGRSFVAAGDFFDPFDQIGRAGLLCHVLLKEAGLPANVARLIVPFGELPAPPPDSWVRVVRPERVRRWIEHGRERLDPRDVSAIADFLWDKFGDSAV